MQLELRVAGEAVRISEDEDGVRIPSIWLARHWEQVCGHVVGVAIVFASRMRPPLPSCCQ